MLVSSKYVDESDMTLKEKNINVSVAKRSDIFNSFLNEFALDIQWNFDSLNKASAPIILSSTSYNTAMYKLLLAILLVLLIYLILFKLYLVLIILFPLLSPQFGNKHKHSIKGNHPTTKVKNKCRNKQRTTEIIRKQVIKWQ